MPKRPILSLCVLSIFSWCLDSSLIYADTAKANAPQAALKKAIVSHDQAGSTGDDARILTLDNAVLLALHHNPDLMMAFNARKVSRYDWYDKKRVFHPKFSLSAQSAYNKYSSSNAPNSATKSASVGPAVTWKLPLGTTIDGTVGYTPDSMNSSGGNKQWQVSITQPLLKGGGLGFNDIDYKQAQDAQVTADYALQTSLMNTISSTISDYYAIVSAKLSLAVANETLKQYQKEAFFREELFKAGRKAQSDVDQSDAQVKTQEQAVQKSDQALQVAKLHFLDSDLGLPENTAFEVVDQIDVKAVNPRFMKAYDLAKAHNLTFLGALLAFKASKYTLLQDRDAMKWQLDLNVTHSRNQQYGSNNASFGQTVETSSARVTLSIPLDTVTHASQRVKLATDAENAKLTYQKALLALQTSVRQSLVSLKSDWQALVLARENLEVTQRTTRAAQIKFSYDKLDALTLSQQQQALVTAKNAIISAEITYLNDKINYQKLVGSLLHDWHITIKDSKHG